MFEALSAGLRKDQVVTSDDDQAHRQKDVAMSVRHFVARVAPEAS